MDTVTPTATLIATWTVTRTVTHTHTVTVTRSSSLTQAPNQSQTARLTSTWTPIARGKNSTSRRSMISISRTCYPRLRPSWMRRRRSIQSYLPKLHSTSPRSNIAISMPWSPTWPKSIVKVLMRATLITWHKRRRSMKTWLKSPTSWPSSTRRTSTRSRPT